MNPSTIFVRNDHKTLALSYFGKAKLLDMIKNSTIRYLSPALIENSEKFNVQNEGARDRNCKDDVFSIGCIIAAICAIGETGS